MLQRCSCLSSVATYLPAQCCRGSAVYVVLKPTCSCLSGVKTYLPYCAAGVKLFKWCLNLSAGTMFQGCSCLRGVPTHLPGTVLQGCSCLSGAATYLPALCCRGAAVYVVLKPTCSCLSGVKTYLPYCAAGVKLLKWCGNLSAGTMFQECSCLRGVATHLWGTVLQGCSCLSGVATYLPALCCRDAAV